MTQTQTPATIDLQKFCATESGRWLDNKPFVAGKWKYATDGRIIIRVSVDGESQTITNDGTAPLPPVEKIFKEPMGQWQDWPTGEKSEVIEKEIE